MITPLGYNHGFYFKASNGKVFCVHHVDDTVWSFLDTDGSFRKKFPSPSHALDFLYRACEKAGIHDFFFRRDAKNRRCFDEAKFNRTVFYPPVEKGGFSEKLGRYFTRTVDGNYRFERWQGEFFIAFSEVPKATMAKLVALPDEKAREALEFLLDADEARIDAGSLRDAAVSYIDNGGNETVQHIEEFEDADNE
jgi:hypothetical protein